MVDIADSMVGRDKDMGTGNMVGSMVVSPHHIVMEPLPKVVHC